MAAVVAAKLINAGQPVWLGLLAGVALGVLVGVVNATLVQRGLNPLVVTIAALTVLGGLAQVVAGGVPITGITQLTWVGSTQYFGIPAPVFVVRCSTLVGWLFLTQTRAGARMTAVGANAEAVRRAGVNADGYRMLGFVLSGRVRRRRRHRGHGDHHPGVPEPERRPAVLRDHGGGAVRHAAGRRPRQPARACSSAR